MLTKNQITKELKRLVAPASMVSWILFRETGEGDIEVRLSGEPYSDNAVYDNLDFVVTGDKVRLIRF